MKCIRQRPDLELDNKQLKVNMDCLPQIVKLMEVLSFLVEKLPSELKTKDKYEEYLKVVTQIVEGCSDDSPLENINIKVDYDHEEGEAILEEEGVFDENNSYDNIELEVTKPEEVKVTPVQIKIESSDNRNLHVHKDNSKQNKCGKSLYAGGIGSFPKVADDEILLVNCVFCEENLETEDLQEEHDKNNHVRDDKYFCPHPECTFEDEIKMKVMHHFTKVHRGMTLRVCSLCKQGYLTTPLLRKHVLDAHGRKTDELTCPTCFDTFPTINTINHHMGYEHIHGHFTCKASTCNKDDKVMEFETKAELDAHRKENLTLVNCVAKLSLVLVVLA